MNPHDWLEKREKEFKEERKKGNVTKRQGTEEERPPPAQIVSLPFPIMLSASFAASGANHFAMATRVHERRRPEVGRQREEGVCLCVGLETRLCERA